MKNFLRISALAILLLGVVVVLRYVGLIHPAQSPQPLVGQSSTDALSTLAPQGQETVEWEIEEVATGLQVPWSIAFTSPTRILIAERPGRIRVVQSGKLQERPLHTFGSIVSRSEEGLMGLTIDPEYEQNKYLYLCYAVPSGRQYQDRVVRMVDRGDSLSEEVVLLDAIPAATNHAGCRVKFGPDGKLYVTTGDATDKQIAQQLDSLGGKILRINSDGSIPPDNPFPNSPVWSYGHRNPQGIAWHPVTETLVATEHGPSIFDGPAGGDEVNTIEKGKNYGWPTVSHDRRKEGMVDPLLVFTPAVAPASALFYDGDVFPQWKNTFFFGLLRGEGIMHVVFDDSGKKPLSFGKLPKIDHGRIRDIEQSPDGAIYFVTSNQDGRGTVRAGDDKLLRIIPASSRP